MMPTEAATTREPARASDVGREPYRPESPHAPGLWVYLLVGILFGITITKTEVISWFRIQEMFRFQGFHMFGVFATALPVAIVSVQLMKRRSMRALTGEPIVVPPKQLGNGVRYAVGGVIFGLGWALTGACPGPLFALLGSGVWTIAIAIVAAMLGTWSYALLRSRLPH